MGGLKHEEIIETHPSCANASACEEKRGRSQRRVSACPRRWSCETRPNSLLLSANMLSPCLNAVRSLETSNEPGIPKQVPRSASPPSSVSDSATDHSSEAIPRSLQHLMRAFDLHPSVAVGNPEGSK